MEIQLKDGLGLIGEVKWEKTRNGILVAESPWMKNQVLSASGAGISVILDRLANITTNSGVVSHAELGDDNTPTNPAQPGVINGLVRANVATAVRSGAQVTFRFFFIDSLTPDDTYYEFGMFTNGSPTIGSGAGFNRLTMLTSPLVKVTGEDITMVCRVTGNV
jgi:hypothetical protein